MTDDAQLLERIGAPVAIVPGEAGNIKITTPEDLVAARRRMDGGLDFRVGLGYDVHRLAPDRALVLGGVRIDHPRGLDGHSDADVLTHAVIDAVLARPGIAISDTTFCRAILPTAMRTASSSCARCRDAGRRVGQSLT